MMIDAKHIAEVTKELDNLDHSISDIDVITEYFIKASKEKGSAIDDVYQAFYLGTHSIMNKLTKSNSEELDLLRFIFEELALKYFSPPDAWRPIYPVTTLDYMGAGYQRCRCWPTFSRPPRDQHTVLSSSSVRSGLMW